MSKTYADICLERVEKATPGPWKYDCGNGQVETTEWRVLICERVGNLERENDVIGMFPDYNEKSYPEIARLLVVDNSNDLYFIATSRTDVPELARRLKRACEMLRKAEGRILPHTHKTFSDFADELEAIPKE